MVSGYIMQGHANKVIQYESDKGTKVTLAGAGEYGKVCKYFDWVRNGCIEDEYSESDGDYSNFLMITDGKVLCFEGYHIPFEVTPPTAIGSGAEYAMGAMLAGADAKKAVEVAMQLDVHTGGNVEVFEV